MGQLHGILPTLESIQMGIMHMEIDSKYEGSRDWVLAIQLCSEQDLSFFSALVSKPCMYG